jgi:hypothetical protein
MTLVLPERASLNIQKSPAFCQFLYFAQSKGMSAALIVNETNGLQETRKKYFPEQPPLLRGIANFISYVFHPVFTPVYVTWFLLFVHPYLFAGYSGMEKTTTLIMAMVSFTFFPLVTVLLLKGLKFIDSIYLRTQKDRVIPFVACMIWYFWIAYVWYNYGKTRGGKDMPVEAIQFAAATFMSTVLGLMVNIKMKVSLHAISAGVVVAFFLFMAFTQPLHFGVWISIVLLVAGLICTSRFIVSDHTPKEVYVGLLTGMVSFLLAKELISWLS